MPFGIKIISQNCQGLVETLGKYRTSVNPGLHFYIPGIQRIWQISLAMRPVRLPDYSVITKDNAEISASVTLNYHVTDAVKFQYENTDSVESMAQLVRGHLRDIIGRMDLNDALGSTAKINRELSEAIGDLTSIYGINVDRLNIDELKPSPSIQAAMDTQLEADRKRVATISKAEGDAKYVELSTKAKNEALVNTAQAEAQSIRIRAEAEAARIAMINDALAKVDSNYFQNQSIQAFQDLANSPANLIVAPTDDASKYGQLAPIAKVFGNAEVQAEQVAHAPMPTVESSTKATDIK